VRTDGKRRSPRTAGLRSTAVVAAAVCVLTAACGTSSKPHATEADADHDVNVNIVLTSKGCAPSPATVSAGHVNFNVSNKNAGAVSEAELRTSDLSHILGEQENLTPGLSGGFSLDVQPGSYRINCPGASQSHWVFTVTGRATGPDWQSDPQLKSAVTAYSEYVEQNVAQLIAHTQRFCAAINSGSLSAAKLAYSPARIYYERIEPVAEVWGSLDTEIDRRWENPVTDPAQFMGFHKIEQLLWENGTLTGAASFCSGLVAHEKALQNLVATAQYSPLEMAAGATDLVNEAATSKISGEEERYSNLDLPTLQANVDGAMEVFSLLQPYLASHDPTLVSQVEQRYQGVEKTLGPFKSTPGYLETGYVEYSTVLDNGRKSLSGAINALAEALSGISNQVG
jgi:iron uptake system component EfeO